MEKGDLELAEVDLIQSLVSCAENEDDHENRFSASNYMTSEITFTVEKDDLEHGEGDLIQDTVESLLDCVKNDENYKNRSKPSIYMAPHMLRDLSPSSFKPRVVSIGPLHKKDENVQELEGRKTSYMIDLMHRTNSPQKETLKTCVEKVYLSMDQIKACYIWTETYDDIAIAKMMVMDACFILHYILSYHFVDFRELDSGNTILRQSIHYDLVLLENQIPIFIVDQIFQCIVLKFIPNTSLMKLIHPILSDLNLFEADIDTNNISISNTCHILSILHQCYKPQCNYPSQVYSSKIHSAVDLDMAGVCFKPNQNPTWVLGMEVKLPRVPCFFWCWSKPTLEMPTLIVGDNTEFIFRNLMAYELSCKTSKHITSYSYAIDMLVNNSKDVAKLVDSRVLLNFMGSNEEVADMINNLGRDVVCDDFFYEQEFKKLNEYCNSYWPKHIASVRSTYFSSPWNMIALLAGIILFALTMVQTIYSIKST